MAAKTKAGAKTTATKLSLNDIKGGSLVSQVRDETVTFWHNGEEMSVDVRIKTLPFAETEPLHARLNEGEDVVAEWISKALVDDNGDQQFTKKQVEDNFVQTLAAAVFDKVWGADNLKKMMKTLDLKEGLQAS